MSGARLSPRKLQTSRRGLSACVNAHAHALRRRLAHAHAHSHNCKQKRPCEDGTCTHTHRR
eukprot:6033290-Pleurochrysis_carterae.AAC.3